MEMFHDSLLVSLLEITSKMKNNSYPKFRPEKKTYKKFGYTFKVFKMTEKEFGKMKQGGSCGVQATFVKNNARMNNSKEFGLKMFPSLWEAACVWERQKIAARKNLAPPVGSLFVIFSKNKDHRLSYGYESCVANPNVALSSDGEDIEDSLFKITIENTPINDILSSVKCNDDDACSIFRYVDRVNFLSKKKYILNLKHKNKFRLGGDLHDENTATWKGKKVCIDFGCHCVVDSYREVVIGMCEGMTTLELKKETLKLTRK